MAPRETPKSTTKVQRSMTKAIVQQQCTKTPVSTIKKSLASKNTSNRINKGAKVNSTLQPRSRTSTATKLLTPKSKENKSVPAPAAVGSVCKSAKKENWKRRPKPAHSGVPVPEKMKKLFAKQLQDPDCSL